MHNTRIYIICAYTRADKFFIFILFSMLKAEANLTVPTSCNTTLTLLPDIGHILTNKMNLKKSPFGSQILFD